MPYIDLKQLRIISRYKKIKTVFCASCQCDREAIDWRSVVMDSVVWVDENTPSILRAFNPICLTCGWMHRHERIQDKKKRQTVFELDNHECVYCGAAENLSIDHITPQVRGGGHEIENLITACRTCNTRKRASQSFLAPRFGRYRK